MSYPDKLQNTHFLRSKFKLGFYHLRTEGPPVHLLNIYFIGHKYMYVFFCFSNFIKKNKFTPQCPTPSATAAINNLNDIETAEGLAGQGQGWGAVSCPSSS